MLALTIADNSYMGLESVSLIDLGTRWQHTRSFMRLMPLGRTGLPSASGQGSVAVERPGYALRFDNDGMRRELIVRVDDFREHKPLTARVTLTGAPEGQHGDCHALCRTSARLLLQPEDQLPARSGRGGL